MDTKIIYLIISLVLFSSCDPSSEKSLIINNESTESLRLTFNNNMSSDIELETLSEVEIARINSSGGDFGLIGDFDFIMLERENKTIIKWLRPDNHLGYIKDNDRDIGKDIYNEKYWTYSTVEDDEQWTFTISEADLDLFE